jgi:hypothetical protein
LSVNARPGGAVGGQGASFTQPTAAVRTSQGFHGKPGIFEELASVNKGPQDGKPRVTPNPFRVDQDGLRGHKIAIQVVGDPQKSGKSRRLGGTTNAVIGHKGLDSVLPALLSSRAHSVDLSVVVGVLAVLLELALYL